MMALGDTLKGDSAPQETVNFIFDNATSGEKHEIYITSRLLSDKSSIRSVGVDVISEVLSNGISHYENTVDASRPISLWVGSSTVCDGVSGWNESGFGIKYALNKNGSIRVLSGYEPLHRDWTLAEIKELVAQGYIKGDASKIIIATPSGLGAPGVELFDWIGFLNDSIDLAVISGVGLLSIKQYTVNRKVRKISRQWVNNGIRYPEQLREFIDTKAGWRLHEVERRLRLDDEFATKLLYALGLEPKANEWRLTHSKRSIENRKRWIRNEKRYRKVPR